MKFYVTDANGVFASEIELDPFGPVPAGSTTTPPPATTGTEVAQLQDFEWVVLPEYPAQAQPAAPTRFELDQARYFKRAAARDSLLAYMAADNMSRVHSGVWTEADLAGLMSDPSIAAASAYMSTLGYELAAQSIAAAEAPLLTPEIRADWIGRLQQHFYLED